MHRLPALLGWGLGVLGLAVGLLTALQPGTSCGAADAIMRACVWFGLCALLGAGVGYGLVLVLPETARDREESESPPAAVSSRKRVRSGPAMAPASAEDESWAEGLTPEAVAEALSTYLRRE